MKLLKNFGNKQIEIFLKIDKKSCFEIQKSRFESEFNSFIVFVETWSHFFDNFDQLPVHSRAEESF